MHTDGKTDGRTEIRKEGQKYNSLYLILIRSKNIILRITDCHMFKGQFLFGGWKYPSPKRLYTFLGPMKSYTVKENDNS